MSIVVRSNEKPEAAAVTETKVEGAEAAKATESADTSAPEASKEATEHKESTEESEPSETEDKESEVESESESSQQSEEEAKDEAGQEKPKKKGGFQRRIDKLNAAKTAAQQEAEYWKQLALKGAGAPKDDATKVETAKTASTEGKPKPDSFETHAEYVEAIADWKAEQKFKERDQREAQSRAQNEQNKAVQTYVERRDAFSAKVDDYDEVIAEVDDIPLSPAVREILLTSEVGPELGYELAKNREEYLRVCKLSPLAAARELGKIEARIAGKSSAETKPDPKKITKAPKPLDPVKAGGKGAVTKSLDDPNLSQSEYERIRKEQMKRKGA